MSDNGNQRLPAELPAQPLTAEEQAAEDRQIYFLMGLIVCGMAVGFATLALAIALDWY